MLSWMFYRALNPILECTHVTVTLELKKKNACHNFFENILKKLYFLIGAIERKYSRMGQLKFVAAFITISPQIF